MAAKTRRRFVEAGVEGVLPRSMVLFGVAALVGAVLAAVWRAETLSDLEAMVAVVLFLTALAYLVWHLWALRRSSDGG